MRKMKKAFNSIKVLYVLKFIQHTNFELPVNGFLVFVVIIMYMMEKEGGYSVVSLLYEIKLNIFHIFLI